MKTILRRLVVASILVPTGAVPATAQIQNGMTFTTSFPFYVENTRMPAGTYRISQTDIDVHELLIESPDGKYSAFIDFIPTHAEQPHKNSDVTFRKYGSVDYLNRVWVIGQRYGMKVERTKAEQKAASAATPVEYTIAGK
jgi:hypothetical protein